MTQKILTNCLLITAAAVAVWLTIRFFLPITLPFLLGLWLAQMAEPAVRVLNKKLKLPRWAGSAVSVSVVFVLTVTILFIVFGILMRQLGHLRNVLPQLEEAARQGLELIRQWLRSLAQHLPAGLHEIVDKLTQKNLSGGGQLAQQALSKLPQIATGLVSRLSSGLFGLLTGIISAYMISGRMPQLKEKLQAFLPGSWQQRYLPVLRGLRKALGGWLLAQVKLAGVAFVLLLFGFFLLKISNGLVLALLITIVDAFPVLGVGTVLLPWSLVCLLQGNPARGFGILGLYAAIWLIRSILEPKLVGKGLGLDPLVTLVTIYAGWQLLGITGMLLAPIFTMAALQMVNALRR